MEEKNNKGYELPENFRGKDVVVLYQKLNGRYTLEHIQNYLDNVETLVSSSKGHEAIGDRHVKYIENVSPDFLEKAINFVFSLDPKTKLTSEDISLEDIVNWEESK